MKKIIAILLAAIMLLSVVSCGNASTSTTTTTTTTTTNNGEGNETPDENEGEGDENLDDEGEGELVYVDYSAALRDTFVAALAANADATVEELINTLATDPVIPSELFMATMPIEAGEEFFTGFGNYTITGYESAAILMPAMSSIALITYVFELPEGADAEAFAEQLKANFDYRWMICDAAGDPVTAIVGNKVFFSSCPANDEMPEA